MSSEETNQVRTMHTRLDVLRRQSDLVAACTDEVLAGQLGNDNLYGSPASFWGDALRAGLVTQAEYDQARHLVGSGWNYRGD